MELLFVYGTLKERKIRKKVIGRIVTGSTDTLNNYKRQTVIIEGEKFPILVPYKKSIIKGILLLITKAELRRVDKYETKAYKRIKVILKSNKRSWVYVKA